MNDFFRTLSTKEKLLIEKMLSINFQNVDKFRNQLSNVRIKMVDETLFKLQRADKTESKIETSKHVLPIEGSYMDMDGQAVFVWLYADRDAELAELEFWKPSGESIGNYFPDENLKVRVE